MTFAMGNLLIGAMLVTCLALWAMNIVHLHMLRVLSHRLDLLEQLLGVRDGQEG